MALDINECETLNGGCEHQCKNTNGSYTCECNKGFSLNGNGKGCSGNFNIDIGKDIEQREILIEDYQKKPFVKIKKKKRL